MSTPESDLVDPETCSWCLTEVEDTDLTDLPDGARICLTCEAPGTHP